MLLLWAFSGPHSKFLRSLGSSLHRVRNLCLNLFWLECPMKELSETALADLSCLRMNGFGKVYLPPSRRLARCACTVLLCIHWSNCGRHGDNITAPSSFETARNWN